MKKDEAIKMILESENLQEAAPAAETIAAEAEMPQDMPAYMMPLRERLEKAEEANKILAEQLNYLISMQSHRETKHALENMKLRYPDFDENEVSRLMQEYAAAIPGVTPEAAADIVRQAFDNPEGWTIFYMANKLKTMPDAATQSPRRPDEHIKASFAAAPAADIRDALKNPCSAGDALLRLGR